MGPLRALLDEGDGVAILGILNRTPDSFSDGGRFVDDAAALAHVEALVAEGARAIDIGAESTRPGGRAVPADEQIDRLGDLVRRCSARGLFVSVDTTSPAVAERALRDGARMVNSVSLEPAAELGALAARSGAALVLMHCRGSMTDMAGFSVYADDAYGDVVADVAHEWTAAAERALAAGLPRGDLVLDPGLGFAKNARHSLELCARLDELCALGFPVMVGPSRKSFVARAAAGGDGPGRDGALGGSAKTALPPPDQRLGGTIAASLACVARGAALLRVHDVGPVRQALAVASAIARAGTERPPAEPFEERHA
jgi:dihydropteroate synthase